MTHRGRQLVGRQRKKCEEEWKGDPKVSGPVFSKEHINWSPPQKTRGTSRHTRTARQVNKSSAGMLLLKKKKKSVANVVIAFPFLSFLENLQLANNLELTGFINENSDPRHS